MKDYLHFILLVPLVMAMFFGCSNPRKPAIVQTQEGYSSQIIKETCGDIEQQKDSLWTVFNESTDEEEVENARELLYETDCQAEWIKLAGKDYERRKASVEKEFQQLVSAHPEYESYFYKEKENWERYHDAVLAVAMLEDHGSSSSLYITGALEQSLDLWLASFHNFWLFEQNQDVSFPETLFTSCMIDDAYTAYIKQADGWAMSYVFDEKDGLKEHHDALLNERKIWDEWMAYRITVSKALSDDLCKIYNGCTNLLVRTKLYQLKNQNEGLGLINDDIDRCLLPDGCTDKELLEYPGFNVALEMYLDSWEN